MYGATATTLLTTHSPITAPYTAGGTVPVGRPLHGKRIHLLDDELRPVPAGQTGEIYVAGAGIARGYLGRPEQTAERFPADPFAGDGTRMYRTGGVGRWNDSDSLDLLGRADHQVKIRGFRVEPAEVAARFAAYPGVSHVAVTTREMEQGLRGTGSITTVAENVFVPQQRILPLQLVLGEQYASATNAASPVYRTPLLPTASALSVGTVLGLARAAKDEFLDRLPGRKITYTAYDHQHDAPLTHLQVADAVMTIDEVRFHAFNVADLVDGKAADGTSWTAEERARGAGRDGEGLPAGQERRGHPEHGQWWLFDLQQRADAAHNA